MDALEAMQSALNLPWHGMDAALELLVIDTWEQKRDHTILMLNGTVFVVLVPTR